ncbi:hypothetical protein WJ968_12365 [Achromobacter xylosoxidans]
MNVQDRLGDTRQRGIDVQRARHHRDARHQLGRLRRQPVGHHAAIRESDRVNPGRIHPPLRHEHGHDAARVSHVIYLAGLGIAATRA